MGFKELMLKAKEQVKPERQDNAEYLWADQAGKLLIEEFRFFEATSGKFGLLRAKILEVKPRKPEAKTQPVGQEIKVMYVCNGKSAHIGYQKLAEAVCRIFGATDAEFETALTACFGSQDGISAKALPEEKTSPMFGARGVLVGFKTEHGKQKPEDIAAGKPPFVNVYFHHLGEDQGNSEAEILERQKSLPQ